MQDPYVSNTGLEGGLGVCAMVAYARRLDAAARQLFREEPALLAQATELAARLATGGAISVMHGAPADAPRANRLREEEDPVAPFRRHYEALRGLAPGDYTVWDAGWLTPPSGGHAIAIVIARDAGSGETGSLTVCNSGDGLGYHPASVADYPKTKYRCALHLAGIPWWRLEDDGFVYTLLRPFVSRLVDRTNGAAPASFYGALLPQVRAPPQPSRAVAAHFHPSPYRRSSSPAATGRLRWRHRRLRDSTATGGPPSDPARASSAARSSQCATASESATAGPRHASKR